MARRLLRYARNDRGGERDLKGLHPYREGIGWENSYVGYWITEWGGGSTFFSFLVLVSPFVLNFALEESK
jgi:hypothetical protein